MGAAEHAAAGLEAVAAVTADRDMARHERLLAKLAAGPVLLSPSARALVERLALTLHGDGYDPSPELAQALLFLGMHMAADDADNE